MEIVTNIALITINETLVVQLLSFLVFLFLINRIMIQPLQRTAGEREEFVEKVRREVEQAGTEFDDLRRRIQQDRDRVRREAGERNRELEEAGKNEAVDLFDRTRGQIQAARDAARREMHESIEAARTSVRQEAEILASQIMEKILERRLDP